MDFSCALRLPAPPGCGQGGLQTQPAKELGWPWTRLKTAPPNQKMPVRHPSPRPSRTHSETPHVWQKCGDTPRVAGVGVTLARSKRPCLAGSQRGRGARQGRRAAGRGPCAQVGRGPLESGTGAGSRVPLGKSGLGGLNTPLGLSGCGSFESEPKATPFTSIKLAAAGTQGPQVPPARVQARPWWGGWSSWGEKPLPPRGAFPALCSPYAWSWLAIENLVTPKRLLAGPGWRPAGWGSPSGLFSRLARKLQLRDKGATSQGKVVLQAQSPPGVGHLGALGIRSTATHWLPKTEEQRPRSRPSDPKSTNFQATSGAHTSTRRPLGTRCGVLPLANPKRSNRKRTVLAFLHS